MIYGKTVVGCTNVRVYYLESQSKSLRNLDIYIFLFRRETKAVKLTSFFRAINGAFYLSALSVVNLVVFTTFVMTGHTLTAERVFVVLGLFMSVRVCFTLFFSLGVMYLKEASVSEKRLQVRTVRNFKFNVSHL